jgi:RNA polymerase sigma-70 factor (ECF subfamily)
MSEFSDERIMVQVRAGRVERLAILFERHHVRLYNFFLRLTGDRPLSEDLSQEVFCRILKYRDTFRDDGTFKAWMYRIAANVRSDHTCRQRAHEALDEASANLADPSPDPGQAWQFDVERRRVRRALGRVTGRKREMLILSRYQDLKYEEIARLCDCSVQSVKTGVYRALQELRQLLDSDEEAKHEL